MTEPQPVMAQPEQDQLTRQVGRSLLTVAGEGWTQVRAEYRSVGRHVEADVFVTGPDGQERPVRPPQEVVEGFGRLRQGMYRPGRGTWLSALYLLEPPSAFSAEFEPDVEPRWRRVPPPIGFADELRFFPRSDEHIPDWLRQRAGLPPAPGDQPPTPPGGTQQAQPQQAGQQQSGSPHTPGGGVPAPGVQSAPSPMGGPPTPPPGQPSQPTPPSGNPSGGPQQGGPQHGGPQQGGPQYGGQRPYGGQQAGGVPATPYGGQPEPFAQQNWAPPQPTN